MTDHKPQFEAGVAAFKKKDYKDAIEHFSAAIDAQASGHMALESRAACYQEMGMYKEALWDAKQIIQLYPDKHNGYSRSSRILTKMGHHARAVGLAQTAVQKPRDVKTLAKVQAILDSAIEAQQVHLENLRLTVCHVNKLPFELLACMFDELVLPGDMRPMPLAHVCRMWRGVIMSMSHIWSTLVLDGQGKRFKSKVEFWMERSRGRIQDLRIRHLSSFLTWKDTYGKSSFPFVDHVTVDFGSDIVKLKPVFRFDANPLSLTWIGGTHEREVPRRLLLTPQEDRPYRLREMELNNIQLQWRIEASQLEDLTKLVITNAYIDLDELIPLLGRSRRIQTLHVAADLRENASGISKERILLPHLTSLGVSESSLILSSIEVPALQNLKFSAMALEPAIQRLSPAEPPLSTLSIENCHNANEAQLPLVDTLTSLCVLRSTLRCKEILDRIVAGKCSLLTHLVISSSDITSGAIVRLIKSRNPAQDRVDTQSEVEPAEETKFARLKFLSFDRCPDIDPEMLPWMRTRVPSVICKYEVKQKVRHKQANGYMV